MGLRDFIERFNTQFYSATSVSSMGWEDGEICGFLNTAQLLLVEESIAMGNFEVMSEIIEVWEYQCSNFKNPEEVNFQKDPLYIIGGTAKYSTHPTQPDRIGALDKVSITEIPYLTNTVMVFRTPKLVVQKGKGGEDKAKLLRDSFQRIDKVYINVVRKPREFNLPSTTTDLNSLLHTRIISTAVEIAAKTMLTQQQSTQ